MCITQAGLELQPVIKLIPKHSNKNNHGQDFIVFKNNNPLATGRLPVAGDKVHSYCKARSILESSAFACRWARTLI